MGYDQTKEKGDEIKSFDKLGQIDPVDLRWAWILRPVSRAILGRRQQRRDDLITVPAIDVEIGVGRKDLTVGV
jgi:hypothetical protein